MRSFLLNELIRPMIHRLGTVTGVYLASVDFLTADQVASIESAVVLLGGIALDLVIRRVV